MRPDAYLYQAGDVKAHGFLAHETSFPGRRAGVVIYHAWRGQGDFERNKARELARLGYVALAADTYGEGTVAADNTAASNLMMPLVSDRKLLRTRLLAAVDALRHDPRVDPTRIAVMGFCFGGLCALEVARSGADVRGVVSFHGLLHPGDAPTAARVPARVLVLHGFDDPMAKPDSVLALSAELTKAQADWQIHMYGNTVHAFTNPQANDKAGGTAYDANADRRSWATLNQFLTEVLG